MVGHNMDGPTRDQLLKFMEEKTRIEQEIQQLQLVLENNHVGMRDDLVDGEGYPRSDIDVYQVRHARHRILCLNNDHKEIMRQIERGLHAVHADIRGSQGEGTSNVQAMDTTITNGHSNGHSVINGHSNGHISNGHISNGVDLVVEGTRGMLVNDRAIAKVNFVSAGSPAEQAGIQVEDEILQFGSVNASNFTALAQIAHVVQHSVGSRVEVVVRRGGGAGAVRLALSPGAWAGRGLLGCNILPI